MGSQTKKARVAIGEPGKKALLENRGHESSLQENGRLFRKKHKINHSRRRHPVAHEAQGGCPSRESLSLGRPGPRILVWKGTRTSRMKDEKRKGSVLESSRKKSNQQWGRFRQANREFLRCVSQSCSENLKYTSFWERNNKDEIAGRDLPRAPPPIRRQKKLFALRMLIKGSRLQFYTRLILVAQ